MELQYTVFLVLAPLSVAAALGTLLSARRYRASAAAETSALGWLVLSLLGWIVLNTLELLAPSTTATLFWARISYLFIASTPLAWFGFALQYSGRKEWLAPSRFVWLTVIPTLTVVLALTNGWHGWIWREYEFVAVNRLLTMRVVTYGWAFWLYVAFAYSLVFLGAFLISRQYFRSLRLYRQQSTWVVIGALIPIVANAIYVFHLIPGLRKDFTSISFAFASVAFSVGILRYRLFDLKPVARDVVIDNMSDAMLTLDARGRVVDVNPAARNLIAELNDPASGRDLIGQPVQQILKRWDALLGHLLHGAAVQTDVAVELGETKRHYEVQISPLTGHDEHLAGRLVILRDISARKQAEEQLRQYALELETQNAELDSFAHTVAHDLKDPLSYLVSCGEYLSKNLDRVPRDEMADLFTSISYTGRTMANIVDELLLLARLRHSTDVEFQPLDMQRLVTNVQSRLGQMIAETRAQVVAVEHWPVVIGYAPWVEEVWVNYLSNALKYGGRPEEGIPPRVELGYGLHGEDHDIQEDLDLAGSHVRFWVCDNGPGLTEEEQAQLFVEFARLPKPRVEGSGLGLTIVRRIVATLGGEVGIESHLGQGSTFWFTLPREKA